MMRKRKSDELPCPTTDLVLYGSLSLLSIIAPDDTFSTKKCLVFLLVHKNICCGYTFEAPCRGDSNEYPQHMIL